MTPTKGQPAYFVNCTPAGSIWDKHLPLLSYEGLIVGVGNELISVKYHSEYIVFDKTTLLSRRNDFKLVEDAAAVAAILAHRKALVEAAYGEGAQVMHARWRRP